MITGRSFNGYRLDLTITIKRSPVTRPCAVTAGHLGTASGTTGATASRQVADGGTAIKPYNKAIKRSVRQLIRPLISPFWFIVVDVARVRRLSIDRFRGFYLGTDVFLLRFGTLLLPLDEISLCIGFVLTPYCITCSVNWYIFYIDLKSFQLYSGVP